MEVVPQNTLYINNINEKIKKDVLKKMLYMLFSQYGKVVQITACKGIKMRGQAWIVFQDVASATNALKGKQGFNFYDKPLRIQFAKEKSHVIARKEGLEVTKKAPQPSTKSQKRPREEDDEGDSTTIPAPKEAKLVVNNKPSNILFAQRLPASVTQDALHAIFTSCAGYKETRLAPGRGVAFVEFENEVQAGIALRQYSSFPLTQTETLHLTYSN